ncbi:MAG: hypothetical protein RL291_1976, partial [Pseudomonadota bacterium]
MHPQPGWLKRLALGAAVLALSAGAGEAQGLEALRPVFARPAAVPVPQTLAQRIALGRSLFSEKALSAGRDASCASCHRPDRAFTDGRRVAQGRGGVPLNWNTPTLWNLAQDRAFFWNGRVPSLEAQARDVIAHPKEMGLPLAEAAKR